MKRRRIGSPSALSVSRSMNALLEGAYWPVTLNTKDVYTRRHDDTDGKTGPDQDLTVTFSADGDAWVMLPGMQSLRFRSWFGGGQSTRVRNALLVLAEAIRRDNEDNPQR